ncbi:urease accessory protein UreF [Actinotignum urinale]|uniref:urease accessory protein UreF n=1 Tax=Actinotignum urinale TaxID=190146 RepID=UPI00370D14AD
MLHSTTTNNAQDIDPKVQLVLWHLTDSALPTGSFAHSQGLEIYMQRDIVHNGPTYTDWLIGFIHQSAYTEGLIARYAAEIARGEATEITTVAELDTLTYAVQIPRQVRDAQTAMGKRTAKVAAIALPESHYVHEYLAGINEGRYHGNPAIVFGLGLGEAGMDVRTAVRAFLMQLATSITQNAIRGIPLGQDAGQQALVNAYPAINKATDTVMRLTAEEFGCTAPGLELAQMQHEALHARMFMS